MHNYVLEGEIIALTSISHIGETYGINAKLRREKIVQPDGSIEEVPIISGNAIRGILRDRGMLHMLRMLGYGVNEADGTVKGFSLPAFYFLFSGGSLTSKAGEGLDIDEARMWREKIPLVALFGGAMGNQIMQGNCKVGKAIPICKETAHIVPSRFITGKELSMKKPNWQYYWGSMPLPDGAEALGIVTRDDQTGALLRLKTGIYVQGNAGVIRTLPQTEVEEALRRSEAAAVLGSIKSKRKADASRENGKRGGRPK